MSIGILITQMNGYNLWLTVTQSPLYPACEPMAVDGNRGWSVYTPRATEVGRRQDETPEPKERWDLVMSGVVSGLER